MRTKKRPTSIVPSQCLSQNEGIFPKSLVQSPRRDHPATGRQAASRPSHTANQLSRTCRDETPDNGSADAVSTAAMTPWMTSDSRAQRSSIACLTPYPPHFCSVSAFLPGCAFYVTPPPQVLHLCVRASPLLTALACVPHFAQWLFACLPPRRLLSVSRAFLSIASGTCSWYSYISQTGLAFTGHSPIVALPLARVQIFWRHLSIFKVMCHTRTWVCFSFFGYCSTLHHVSNI